MSDPITLRSDALRADIDPHGARLTRLRLHGQDMILHADPVQYPGWHDVYAGAIVGPVANRVARGCAVVGGQTHRMACNEQGRTALHSGPEGLDRLDWSVAQQTDTALHLRITLADGAMGLPGTRDIGVRFAIAAATLTLDIAARTTAPTPMSIAHHPYWRLGDAGDHLLQVGAAHYLPVDGDSIPTGQVAPVAGTRFDHTVPAPLARDIDNNLCVARYPVSAPRHVATLWGSAGLRLDIDSTEPGLQVYAGAHLPTLPGTDIAPFAGIALEPQGWPDAVNQPVFPSVIASPDHPYRQITRYRFSGPL